jgi:hypothetical protein
MKEEKSSVVNAQEAMKDENIKRLLDQVSLDIL